MVLARLSWGPSAAHWSHSFEGACCIVQCFLRPVILNLGHSSGSNQGLVKTEVAGPHLDPELLTQQVWNGRQESSLLACSQQFLILTDTAGPTGRILRTSGLDQVFSNIKERICLFSTVPTSVSVIITWKVKVRLQESVQKISQGLVC